MKKIRKIWKCKLCGDVVISYTHLSHDMNYCECGKSAVDLESSSMRVIGEVDFISTKENIDGVWVDIDKQPIEFSDILDRNATGYYNDKEYLLKHDIKKAIEVLSGLDFDYAELIFNHCYDVDFKEEEFNDMVIREKKYIEKIIEISQEW